MNWQVVSRPEAENDVIEIAAWYDSRSENLGEGLSRNSWTYSTNLQ